MRVAALVLVAALSGCSIQKGDFRLDVFQLSPGDEVQTQTITQTGVQIEPVGPQGPKVSLGYSRIQQNRVPGFDAPACIPDVSISSGVGVNSAVSVNEVVRVGNMKCAGPEALIEYGP